MRTRRICVGTVYRDGFLIRNGSLTSRRCLSIQWRGLEDWCQPCQVDDEVVLRGVVGHRLALAGLGLVDLTLGAGRYASLDCTVRRLHAPHRRAVRVNQMRQRWAKGNGAATEGPPPLQASVPGAT
jgi:hypothetical protein